MTGIWGFAMIWLWLSLLFFAVAMCIVIRVFVRDRRYERKKASEVFGPALRQEIDKERQEGLERREKFMQTLKKAQEYDKKTEDTVRIGEPKG